MTTTHIPNNDPEVQFKANIENQYSYSANSSTHKVNIRIKEEMLFMAYHLYLTKYVGVIVNPLKGSGYIFSS